MAQSAEILRRLRKKFDNLLVSGKNGTWRDDFAGSFEVDSQLRDVLDFGDNPGALRMRIHVPERLPDRPALIVALHGCTQTAEIFAHGTGWSAVAERSAAIVLFPEQQRANNPNLCFSWFQPSDVRRSFGEAESIRQMVKHAVAEFDIDPGKVFITGLSAGGAMAGAMLVAYPDVFAAGTIIAGLPFGAATSVQQAFREMQSGKLHTSDKLGDRVRAASDHKGPWPRVSVWHGEADSIVNPANGSNVAKQWLDLHGRDAAHAESASSNGRNSRRRWSDERGQTVVELNLVAGMDHGVPLATGGPDRYGTIGPFFLEAGISSTAETARFFGLELAERIERTEAPVTRPANISIAQSADHATSQSEPVLEGEILGVADVDPVQSGSKALAFSPHAIIQAAYRSAGLANRTAGCIRAFRKPYDPSRPDYR